MDRPFRPNAINPSPKNFFDYLGRQDFDFSHT
jgi:hypothetical protein